MFWSTVPLTGMPGTVAQSHGGLISFEQTRTVENLNKFLPKRKTNTAPGIDGFPQVDLTTALAAWKLSLTKRFPS